MYKSNEKIDQNKEINSTLLDDYLLVKSKTWNLHDTQVLGLYESTGFI